MQTRAARIRQIRREARKIAQQIARFEHAGARTKNEHEAHRVVGLRRRLSELREVPW